MYVGQLRIVCWSQSKRLYAWVGRSLHFTFVRKFADLNWVLGQCQSECRLSNIHHCMPSVLGGEVLKLRCPTNLSPSLAIEVSHVIWWCFCGLLTPPHRVVFVPIRYAASIYIYIHIHLYSYLYMLSSYIDVETLYTLPSNMCVSRRRGSI